ncbi:MAG: restriction endonuclease subunit S, partial [Gammaproteobacteria bacterium]
MIANLHPYPAYKDSGIPWLGRIPAHWELRRIKTLLRQRSEKGYPEEPLLAATQTKGVVRKENYENRTVLALKDLHLLKLVKVGDFVISLRSFQGGLEYAREQGIISPAYTILYPVDEGNHAYLAKLFKSKPFIENLNLYVTGIRQGQNIDYVKLSRSSIPLPPLAEQRAIARYLDWADSRIRRLIRARQRQIKLLEEYKQALIHQAVTGQVDVRTGQPYPAYKDSGVEWL